MTHAPWGIAPWTAGRGSNAVKTWRSIAPVTLGTNSAIARTPTAAPATPSAAGSGSEPRAFPRVWRPIHVSAWPTQMPIAGAGTGNGRSFRHRRGVFLPRPSHLPCPCGFPHSCCVLGKLARHVALRSRPLKTARVGCDVAQMWHKATWCNHLQAKRPPVSRLHPRSRRRGTAFRWLGSRQRRRSCAA
jgi:hypothetical protein